MFITYAVDKTIIKLGVVDHNGASREYRIRIHN
jgi:hypothetical protein